jgi:hypothetical protein
MEGRVAPSIEPFKDHPGTIARIREFLETRPLYVKLRLPLPEFFHHRLSEFRVLGDSLTQKAGQLPMWLPAIPKEIKDELGDDSEIYQKALRNMNEGYGIGACAYLRRLIEKHINPLLQVLHGCESGSRRAAGRACIHPRSN